MLNELVGSAALKTELEAAVGLGRLPHGILLCGEDGLGRDFAARLLAAELLPGLSEKDRRAAAAGEHPAVHLLRPQGAAALIPVEAVRSARKAVQSTSLACDGQAVVVQGAHRLNPAAAAALLKTLEEPAPGVFFILTAPTAAGVLPTILSRCVVYTLGEATRQECLSLLAKRYPKADGAFLYAVFGGRPGLLLRCAGERAMANRLDSALETAGYLAAGDRAALLGQLATMEGKKERARDWLELLFYVLSASLTGPGHPRIPALGQGAAARCLAAAETMRQALERSGNLRLALTGFCVGCLPAENEVKV